MATPPTPNPVFNPSDFVTASSGGDLTEAQANLKYMRLATESTATALETFQAGISTPSISNDAGDSILTIGAVGSNVNFVGGVRFEGVGSTYGHVLTSNGVNNTPSFKVTNLDTPTPTTAVNLLLNQTTGDAALCATQNSGALNIGCASARSGTIAIANGGNVTCITSIHNSTSAKGTLNLASGLNATTVVNLAAGATSTGTLSIGAAGRALTLKGSATSNIDILTGTVKCGALSANSIDTQTAGVLTIGGTNCSGVVFSDTVGACTFTGGISGTSLGMTGQSTLAGVSATSLSTSSLDAGLPAGDLSVAASQTSGVLSIANGSRSTAGIINLGCGSGAIVNPINIGSSTSKTTVGSGFVFSGTSLNANPANTGSLAICPEQNFGNLHIGGSATRGVSGALTSEINIGNGTVNNFPINIGNYTGTAAQTNIGNLNVSSLTKCTGVLSAIGGLKTDSIDSNTATTLTLGGTNCTGIVFSDNVASVTSTGAISAAGLTSSTTVTSNGSGTSAFVGLITSAGLTVNAAITNTGSVNSPFSGSISASKFSSTVFDTASAALLQIGQTYANAINIGNSLTGNASAVNMQIANSANYAGNLEIACGNNSRTGTTAIHTKGSGGCTIGSASASLALNSTGKVTMVGGLSTTSILLSDALGVTGTTSLGVVGTGALTSSSVCSTSIEAAVSGGSVLNIGNGAGTGTINVGYTASSARQINIGSASLQTSSINIGGTGLTTIGTGGLSILGALTSTGNFICNAAISLGTIPTAPAHLGYVFGGDIGGASPVASGTVVSSITIAQTGTFLFSWYYQQYYPSTAPTQPTMSFSGYGGSMGFVTVSSNYNECNGDAIISRTTATSTTYNLIFNYQAAGSMSSYQGFFKAVRVG